MRAVELFAGAGGLGMGVQLAGFEVELMIEHNPHACATLRANGHGDIVHEGDVRQYDYSHIPPGLSLLSGGPPCQPFSVGGVARGKLDARDMWPEAVRAVTALRPKVFLFENVKGMMRQAFAEYLRLTLDALAKAGDGYHVSYRLFNAADFGVPSKRERLIVVGVRRDLNKFWEWPTTTHSQDGREGKTPWQTVRQALEGLPDPETPNNIANHIFVPGARAYPGHTGSPIDGLAKTLKAGDHGVPGGENMIAYADGTCRYFTVREAARIQHFPDDYVFKSSRGECMRQIGNAVPVTLARALAEQVKRGLVLDKPQDSSSDTKTACKPGEETV